MKQSIKISVMALVAMFAFSTVADAQFGLGGLVKSAKKALKKEKKTIEETEKRAESAPKKTSKGTCEVRNWETGEMMTIEKPYASMEVKTAEEILGWEKNFRDKEGKQQIVEYVLDTEKFENKTRKATNLDKDRKLVQVIFRSDDWQLYYDAWGDVNGRSMWICKIFELTNKATKWETIELKQNYGGGKYSDFSNIMGSGDNGYVKDWEHNPDADPLKDL